MNDYTFVQSMCYPLGSNPWCWLIWEKHEWFFYLNYFEKYFSYFFLLQVFRREMNALNVKTTGPWGWLLLFCMCFVRCSPSLWLYSATKVRRLSLSLKVLTYSSLSMTCILEHYIYLFPKNQHFVASQAWCNITMLPKDSKEAMRVLSPKMHCHELNLRLFMFCSVSVATCQCQTVAYWCIQKHSRLVTYSMRIYDGWDIYYVYVAVIYIVHYIVKTINEQKCKMHAFLMSFV